MEIASVDGTQKIVTLTKALKYKHISQTDSYFSNTQEIVMRGEVGLLTRNIVMKGFDAMNQGRKYGSHLLLTGRE